MGITLIRLDGASYDSFTFPCGELHLQLKGQDQYACYNIYFEFEKNEEIIELFLLVDAIRRWDTRLPSIQLHMPYVPFSRQDRINNPGEPLSIKVFCDLINQCKFEEVFINDPHSDVTPALLNNCHVKLQHENFLEVFADRKNRNFYLLSPDAGASKKIYKLAEIVRPRDVIECRKQRNSQTGEILDIDLGSLPFTGHDIYIVDDICDGGKTFIKIAEKIKAWSKPRIILLVTHGFFTKGLGVFDGLIDEIYTRKGRVK